MPEMIPLGWFHTIMGVVALISGAVCLLRYKEITVTSHIGRVYLVSTLITAATALMIYQHGGFGIAHLLAIATLGALAIGSLAAFTQLCGRWSRSIRAVSFTATLLFHSIPAVTDALLRLPVGSPILDSIDDPIMKASHLTLLVLFLIGIVLQLRWIKRQPKAG